MTRWFSAQLDGSYVGEPSEKSPKRGGRRHQLRVYRAALRDLRWLPEPAASGAEAASDEPVLRQLRIEHAHVAGVRGPGTWYEGPVFDLVIRSVRLTHPTEKDGRAYGRIVGAAVGWLELPPEPVQPEVIVSERTAAPVAAEPPAPLTAAVYRQLEPSAAAAEPVGSAAPSETEAEAHLPLPAEQPPPPAAPGRSALLPLTAASVVIGIGLFIGCSAGSLALWSLFMLPTLLARRLFLGVLRDGAFLRGFGYACIALQAFCVSQLVSSAWSSGCPELALLPMLGVIAVLFPAGLLPSALPLSCTALGLALVLAAFGQAPAAHCSQQPRVTPEASAR